MGCRVNDAKLTLRIADAELVLGIVGPVGADLDAVVTALDDRLRQFGYTPQTVRLSTLIKTVTGLKTSVEEEPPSRRFETYMNAGNEARTSSQRDDILALAAIAQISGARVDGQPRGRRAYILRSLKHPSEVRTLREVYGHGFFLLGIHSPKETRLNYLINDKGIERSEAEDLLARDEAEVSSSGQRTRDTFELADAFVALHASNWKHQVWRTLDLLFGCPTETPTQEEYGMFQAYAASFRSADLSRQVGAVIMSSRGEIVATGCNDVPASGGGLYWPDSEPDVRDFQKGYDSNARQKTGMLANLLKALGLASHDADQVTLNELIDEHRPRLKDTGILDITEFGRAVHAEMDAILSCARVGVSARGATLFSTTFPCHNCAKHIVAAGISKVVYIEPYPKSKALELHDDAIHLASDKGESNSTTKVLFEPFVGVGPRCFVDLFSMTLGDGRKLTRKSDDGNAVRWARGTAALRVPLQPTSYLENEAAVSEFLNALLEPRNQGKEHE